MTVAAPGYASREVRLVGPPAPGRSEHTVELLRAARITGRTVDEAGQPLPAASLRLTRRSDDLSARTPVSVESDGDGRFTFEDLSAATWTLRASLAGRAPAEDVEVLLADEETRDVGDLVLPLGGGLEGVVLAPDGRPLPGAEVIARRQQADDAEGPALKAAADSAGRFRFADLTPAVYRATTAPGGEASTTVVAGDVAEVVLRTRRLARVFGQVSRRSLPLADVVVSLTGKGMFENRSVRSDDHGDFELTFETGQVVVTARDGPSWTGAVYLELDWDQEQRVDLTFAEGRIAGSVRSETDGGPLAKASVTADLTEPAGFESLHLRGRHAHRRVESGPEGRFALERLPPGRWTVRVSQRDHVAALLAPIDLAADEAVEDLDVVLPAGAVLTGQVHMVGDGPPWDRLGLTAVRLDGAGEEARGSIDPQGSYRVGGLAAGAYRIQVRRLGGWPLPPDIDHVFVEIVVTLAAGEQVQRDLTAVAMDVPAGP